jgi:type IV pilus assembly protein PilW
MMRRPSSPFVLTRQRGVTLVELMIALTLGALVVLAATAMVVSSRSTYRSQDENTRLAESARFGLELGNRLVRLAGFTIWGDSTSPPPTYVPDPTWATAPNSYAMNGPNIVGSNNSKPGGAAGVNGSDSLTIRFFGAGLPGAVSPAIDREYGNVLDCGGSPVPQSTTTTSMSGAQLASAVANAQRAFNVLYVDYDVDGEPSLFCQRQTYNAATGLPNVALDTQVLIRGVESFQVLYGEYIPPVGQSLDDVAPINIVYRTGIGGPNPVVNWTNIRSVRIAMLMRSATGARTDPDPTTAYALFGVNYPASSDPGALFDMTSLSALEKTRVRRVVETTVFVRNRESQWTAAQFNY